MNKFLRTLAVTASLLFAQQLHAQTHIVDTLYSPTDSTVSTVSGSYTVESQAINYNGRMIGKVLSSKKISAGVIDLYLPPTDHATDIGASYTVTFELNGSGGAEKTSYKEIWLVPTSSTPVTLLAVRGGTPPAPSTRFLLSQLSPLPPTTAGQYCIQSVSGSGVWTVNLCRTKLVLGTLKNLAVMPPFISW